MSVVNDVKFEEHSFNVIKRWFSKAIQLTDGQTWRKWWHLYSLSIFHEGNLMKGFDFSLLEDTQFMTYDYQLFASLWTRQYFGICVFNIP